MSASRRELDVDELVGQVVAAAAAAPETLWELLVLAPDRRQVLAQVEVPPLGWATVETGGRQRPESRPSPRSSPRIGRSRTDSRRATVDDDGTFRLARRRLELVGVGRLVDGGEFGDSYNYGPPADDLLVEAPLAVSVEALGVRAAPRQSRVRVATSGPSASSRSGVGRTAATVKTEVATTYEMRAGEPFVRVRVEFDNRSRDHRTRWHIPLPAAATSSAAEGQFAVVERGLTMEGGHGEVPLPTYPARGFVHAAGVSVLFDHLTEYELVDDGRELAITVLRSFG